MGRPAGRTEYASAFGRALAEQLATRSVRQADLARATGVSTSYINRLMTGSSVSAQWTETVADALNLKGEERAKLHRAAAISAGYRLDLTKPK